MGQIPGGPALLDHVYAVVDATTQTLSADGTRAVVGAPRAEIDLRREVGCAHVYVRTEAGWTEETILTAPTPASPSSSSPATAPPTPPSRR